MKAMPVRRKNSVCLIIFVQDCTMYATSRHGTPNLTSLPKDGGVSCFGRLSGKFPIQLLT